MNRKTVNGIEKSPNSISIRNDIHQNYYSRSSTPEAIDPCIQKLLPEIAADGRSLNFDKNEAVDLPKAPYIFGGVAALTTFAYGFNAGIIAVILLPLNRAWNLPTDSLASSFIVSSMLAGAVVGSVLPGWIGSFERIGRKPMILLTNAILVIGALSSYLSTNTVQLITARVIVGLGIGFGSIIPSLYITEMSPASIRGFLGILNQFAGFIGILASYCAGLICFEEDWQKMFLLAAFVAFSAFCASALVLPESPRWLINCGRNRDALVSLSLIYGHNNGTHFTDEFAKIYAHLSRPSCPVNINSSLSRRTLFTILILQLIQQAAGSGFVTYYSATIFRSWGLSGRKAIIATVLSAVPQLFVFGVVARWSEALGRKRLLLISEAAMGIVLFYLAIVTFLVAPSNFSHWQAVLVFIGLSAHRVAYALGLAPVPTVLIAEILPFSLRSRGLATALTINWFLNFVITSTIPLAAAFNSLYWVYLTMAGFAAAGFIFVHIDIEETRGIVLDAADEIHMLPVIPANSESRLHLSVALNMNYKPLEPPPIHHSD